MIEVLYKGTIPVEKYKGTCYKCRTMVQCDYIDLKESHGVMGRVHYLDCPTCSHPIVMSCTSSLLHGLPHQPTISPAIGPVYTGPARFLRDLSPNPSGTGDRI